MNKTDKNEEYYKKVACCESWEELDKVIDELGEVEGTRGIMYSASKIKQGIEAVKAGGMINYVTRTYGLRAKVAELLYY